MGQAGEKEEESTIRQTDEQSKDNTVGGRLLAFRAQGPAPHTQRKSFISCMYHMDFITIIKLCYCQ